MYHIIKAATYNTTGPCCNKTLRVRARFFLFSVTKLITVWSLSTLKGPTKSVKMYSNKLNLLYWLHLEGAVSTVIRWEVQLNHSQSKVVKMRAFISTYNIWESSNGFLSNHCSYPLIKQFVQEASRRSYVGKRRVAIQYLIPEISDGTNAHLNAYTLIHIHKHNWWPG